MDISRAPNPVLPSRAPDYISVTWDARPALSPVHQLRSIELDTRDPEKPTVFLENISWLNGPSELDPVVGTPLARRWLVDAGTAAAVSAFRDAVEGAGLTSLPAADLPRNHRVNNEVVVTQVWNEPDGSSPRHVTAGHNAVLPAALQTIVRAAAAAAGRLDAGPAPYQQWNPTEDPTPPA